MKFALKMKRFSRDEDGAVTVDWVVLTAAIVGLAVVAFGTIKDDTKALVDGISADLEKAATAQSTSEAPG
ncbi:Flp family type IVb pilin [Sulfitobacter sp. 1A13353]|uniref:Flp family type IVb pilin n=1 Tax=Sulfitobacter sp. 1A13353 TaxID=3368568 RepID=UPI003745FB96